MKFQEAVETRRGPHEVRVLAANACCFFLLFPGCDLPRFDKGLTIYISYISGLQAMQTKNMACLYNGVA